MTGDPLAEIAILLAQSALDDRKSSRAQARLADQQAVTAGLARVSALQAKADAQFVAGVLAGGAQMALGAGQLAGGIMGETGSTEAEVNQVTGTGKASEGLLTVFSAIAGHHAGEADAAAAREEVQAGAATRAHDMARGDAQSAQELYDRFVQSYKELVQTRNATLLASVRG
jgi:hypothetical protein